MSPKIGKCGNVLLATLVMILFPAIGIAVANVPDSVSSPNSWLNITPGGNASQLCFSWATASSHTPSVQMIKTTGTDTMTFTGSAALQAQYDSTGGPISAGWYQNKVTATGLALSTNYTYRVGYGSTWSDFHTIQTMDTGSFTIIAVGDPQLGAATSGTLEPPAQASNVLGYDSLGWQTTMTVATTMITNASFLVSLGDQIDNTSSHTGVDPQYNDYFCPPQLLSLPVSTIDGNHDYGLGHYHGFHYNLPNQSAQNGATSVGNDGDYWYTYGQALFMVINSNTQSVATHDVFIGQAIAANPTARWRIVMFHHTLYSCADHALDPDILFRRSAYPPVFDEYHVDVVLSGHDHTYERSYQMLGGMPVSRTADSIMAVNPRGTLYMTLNSGSGSKFYPLNAAFTPSTMPVYSKTYWQQNEPTFSKIKINADTFAIVTYAITGSTQTASIDSYTIVKTGMAAGIGAVSYIGDTLISGSGKDSSGLAATILEDGVSPMNALNGFGSGLGYAGGNEFFALCDRGPNKVGYTGGAKVDSTTSWPCRFQRFSIAINAVAGSLIALDTPVAGVGAIFSRYSVVPTLTGTSLLKDSLTNKYIGLSSAFAANVSTHENRRLDPEGIRVAPDHTVWISDEYGPWILHFDTLGNQLGQLPVPAGFRCAVEDSTLVEEMSLNTTGRTTNKGLEGLALTPDGNTLVALLQSPLIQDSSTNGLNNRMLVYDLTHPANAPKQYLYPLDNTSQSISELLAINNHQFLADERNGKGGAAGVKLLYLIDLSQAAAPTDLSATAYDGTTAARGLPGKTIPSGIVPLHKTLFANIGNILLSSTIWPFSNVNGLDSLPDKIEGYAFGPNLPDGRHLLLATNDNDFVQPGGAAGTGYPNYFFAFAVDTTSVPGFLAEALPPSGIVKSVGRPNGSFVATARLHHGVLVVDGLEGATHLEIYRVSGVKVQDLGKRVFAVGSQHVALQKSLSAGFYLLKISGAHNLTVPLVQH
jgi:Esterase-like activity of phytase/Calcineurin-like phosphoesterase/Purple acid Phosphatase, N-terminal domain